MVTRIAKTLDFLKDEKNHAVSVLEAKKQYGDDDTAFESAYIMLISRFEQKLGKLSKSHRCRKTRQDFEEMIDKWE